LISIFLNLDWFQFLICGIRSYCYSCKHENKSRLNHWLSNKNLGKVKKKKFLIKKPLAFMVGVTPNQ